MRTCREIVTENMEDIETLEIINDAVIVYGNSYPVTVDEVTEGLTEHLDEGRIDKSEYDRAVCLMQDSPELLADDGRDVFEMYLEDVLDIETHGKRSGEDWDVTSVKVWLTLGGPNVWLVSDLSGDDVKVHAAWGTDSAEMWATCPGIVHYLQALTDY